MKPQLTLRRVQKIIATLDSRKFGAEYHIRTIEKYHVYQEAKSGKCMCLTRYRIILYDLHVCNSYTDFLNWQVLDPYCKHIETMTIQKAMEAK